MSLTHFKQKTSIFTHTDIDIKLGGGNDTLRIYDTNVPGTLTIDMGSGNDTLENDERSRLVRTNTIRVRPATIHPRFRLDREMIWPSLTM